MLVSELRKAQLGQTYEAVISFLKNEFGVTLNQDYFNIISFEPVQNFKVSFQQKTIPLSA